MPSLPCNRRRSRLDSQHMIVLVSRVHVGFMTFFKYVLLLVHVSLRSYTCVSHLRTIDHETVCAWQYTWYTGRPLSATRCQARLDTACGTRQINCYGIMGPGNHDVASIAVDVTVGGACMAHNGCSQHNSCIFTGHVAVTSASTKSGTSRERRRRLLLLSVHAAMPATFTVLNVDGASSAIRLKITKLVFSSITNSGSPSLAPTWSSCLHQ